jgi:hypothetical protein
MDREARLNDSALNLVAVEFVLAGEVALLLTKSAAGTIGLLELDVEGVQYAGEVGEYSLLLHLPLHTHARHEDVKMVLFNDIPHLLTSE